MNLVLFDIDGTLISSVELDDRCFVRALADVLGIDNVSSDWSRYKNATDSGLAQEIVRRCFGRNPTDEEIDLLRERCCQLLRRVTGQSRTAVRETPGASHLLAVLRRDTEWRPAIASGSWRETAQIKLEAAGLDVTDLPGAFASDSPDRREILHLAVARAGDRYAVRRFGKVVYVGDGVWDAEAARAEGIAFVGMGGGRAEALRKAGVTSILDDFVRLDAVFRSLHEARVPPPAPATLLDG